MRSAMILAAGLGTRLKPFTDFHPKALAIVNGQTLLERNIKYLQQAGIVRVVVNVHHFADQIEDYLKKNKGFASEIIISDERKEVLETGGGIKKAAPYFQDDEHFLVMNVDIISNLNLGNLFKAHLSNESLATLAVMDRPATRCLEFNAEWQLCAWRNLQNGENKIVSETLGALHRRAFSGIQILRNSFLEMPDFNQRFSTIDVYLKRAKTHKVIGFDHTGDLLIDVGKPDSLRLAGELLNKM